MGLTKLNIIVISQEFSLLDKAFKKEWYVMSLETLLLLNLSPFNFKKGWIASLALAMTYPPEEKAKSFKKRHITLSRILVSAIFT